MKKIYTLSALLVLLFNCYSQDLESLLDEQNFGSDSSNKVQAIFKGGRVITMHSVKNPGKNQLDFIISHRFGRVNTGIYEYFGLDQSTIRFGLEYGITDRLSIGYGRSSNNKVYDGTLKAALLQQQSGKKNIPLSVTLVAGAAVKTLKWTDTIISYKFSHRMTYVFELLVARKLSSRVSMQLTPGILHRNLVETPTEKNDVYYTGVGGRFKITNRMSINAEYFYILPDQLASGYTNPLSVGMDLDTGGHVFQIQLSNSLGMNERSYIGETNGKWTLGDIHLGFNIVRTFNFNKKV